MYTSRTCSLIGVLLMLTLTSEAQTNAGPTDQQVILGLRGADNRRRELPQSTVVMLEHLSATTNDAVIALLCQKIDFIDPRYDPSLGSLKPVELSYPVVAALVRIGTNAVSNIATSLGTEKDSLRRRLLQTTRDTIQTPK